MKECAASFGDQGLRLKCVDRFLKCDGKMEEEL